MMRPARRRPRSPAAAVLIAAVFGGGAERAGALSVPEPTDRVAVPAALVLHDIPSDVTIQAFVVPEDGVLRVLVRVPLEAMRDFDFPVRGPGYLDIEASQPLLADAARLWIAGYVEFFEDGRRLERLEVVSARIAVPSDRTFARYEEAFAAMSLPPLPGRTELVRDQALLDVWFETPIADAGSRFSMEPRFAHLGLRTTTAVRFRPPGGAERAFQFLGDPGLVYLDPRWHQAAWRFVKLGISHILDGVDHLLFLLCLVIPVRRLRGLVPVITSFTVAHSITLLASAFGFAPSALWFPPLIEALIALSIVYMAIENIVGAKPSRRWILAFGFGLVHGFGFSFALRETLQFAGSHLVTSLLSFNVGVEIGQLIVVALTVPVVELLFRRVVTERLGTILLSAFLAHSGWHWMTDRLSRVAAYRFEWPSWDLTLLAGLMRWTMLILIVGGVGWLLRGLFGRWPDRAAAGGEAAGAAGGGAG